MLGSSARAGPVGQTGMCLFGTGTEHSAGEEELMDSRERGGVMVEDGRCGGIGLGRAMVAISAGATNVSSEVRSTA